MGQIRWSAAAVATRPRTSALPHPSPLAPPRLALSCAPTDRPGRRGLFGMIDRGPCPGTRFRIAPRRSAWPGRAPGHRRGGSLPVSDELVLGPEVSPLRQALPQGSPRTSAPRTSARSRSSTTTTRSAETFTREAIAARAPDHVAVPRAAAGRRRADRRPARRRHARWSRPIAWPEALGVAELYIKNDAVNHPTLSFKDRVVAVALSKAVEFGFKTVGCASTGNLAGSVAANAAAAGLEAYVLIPDDLEAGQGPRRDDLRRQGHRHPGQLRPRQPALLADRLPVRLGLRQRQPPAVLRRGVEVDGLRDRRGPRLAGPRPRRRPDGRRQPDRQAPQGVQGVRARSA